MDVINIRPRATRLRRVVVPLAFVAGGIGVGMWALPGLVRSHMAGEPVAVRDSLVIDTVRRGPLERDVTAAGVLVPDRIHVAASSTDGVVAEVLVRAGAHVSALSVIARLANPDLAVAIIDAAARLAAARADVHSAREEAAAVELDADATLRSARAEDARADVEATSDIELHGQGLIGDLAFRSAVIKRAEDHDLVAIARRKIDVGAANARARIAAAQARVDEIAAEIAAKRAALATLVVDAGAEGTVQSVAVDAGQRVTSGTEFVRIADDHDLKAVLQVAESDMRGVVPGLRVRVVASDSATQLGRVTRLAPAAQNGTVSVEVALDHPIAGTRADANIDGTIVLARFADTLTLARPADATDGAHAVLFRLDADGKHAERTTVDFGVGSEDRVQIRSGLAAGDRVIVSDTSSFDAPTLRIAP